MAQRPVQPGIWRGGRRPRAFVQAREDQQIGALHPRLERAPDQDMRMCRVRIAHLVPGKHGVKQAGVIAGRDVAAKISLLAQFGGGVFSLAPGGVFPQLAVGRGLATLGDLLGQIQMGCDAGGQGLIAGGLMPAETKSQPFGPSRGQRVFLRGGPCGEITCLRIGGAVAAQVQLQFVRQAQMCAALAAGMGQRVFQQGQKQPLRSAAGQTDRRHGAEIGPEGTDAAGCPALSSGRISQRSSAAVT